MILKTLIIKYLRILKKNDIRIAKLTYIYFFFHFLKRINLILIINIFIKIEIANIIINVLIRNEIVNVIINILITIF